MKSILGVLFVTLCFVRCDEDSINDPEKRNENWCWFIDMNTGKGSWVPFGDKQTVESGRYVYFYSNGFIRCKGRTENYLDVDTIYHFDLKGNYTHFDVLYGDSTDRHYVEDGPFQSYYSTTEVEYSGTIKDRERIGTWKRYDRSGHCHRIIRISGDTLQFTELYVNGNIDRVWSELNNIPHGPFKMWYEDGTLKTHYSYVNGVPHSEYNSWYPNGNKKKHGIYRNGKAEGVWYFYYEDGTLKSEDMFQNDLREGPAIGYYSEGGYVKYHHVDDRIEGKVEFFDAQDKLERVAHYRNGKEI
ncbi:toxin-antitoxin system YwqK family antitoxin [bacterium SCSIO 12741]|nr:toxin-antitoxin system YwqK family antitoxin [bacterium SCSIO 12741]